MRRGKTHHKPSAEARRRLRQGASCGPRSPPEVPLRRPLFAGGIPFLVVLLGVVLLHSSTSQSSLASLRQSFERSSSLTLFRPALFDPSLYFGAHFFARPSTVVEQQLLRRSELCSVLSIKFSGFRSACVMPMPCKKARAEAHYLKSRLVSASEKAPFLIK